MSQIFKWPLPHRIIFGFLEKVTTLKDGYYVFNTEAYKRAVLYELIPPLIETVKKYYYVSKRTYVERKITYSTFLTILRQICKYNNVEYKTGIKYGGSSYDINYYIRKTDYENWDHPYLEDIGKCPTEDIDKPDKQDN